MARDKKFDEGNRQRDEEITRLEGEHKRLGIKTARLDEIEETLKGALRAVDAKRVEAEKHQRYALLVAANRQDEERMRKEE
eukprot:13685786-Heterocapsa_arctica.AAC.1